MHDDAPRLDGVHHLKLPVTDLERSSSWYRSRFGYEPDMEFHREGRLVGLALKHPHGGPALALWLDPARAAAAGFAYFAIGVPNREALDALAERLSALGERHPGVHRRMRGGSCPMWRIRTATSCVSTLPAPGPEDAGLHGRARRRNRQRDRRDRPSMSGRTDSPNSCVRSQRDD